MWKGCDSEPHVRRVRLLWIVTPPAATRSLFARAPSVYAVVQQQRAEQGADALFDEGVVFRALEAQWA